jgi:hypothetical protein
VAHCDADRTATIVVAPRLLAASGTGLLTGAAAALGEALDGLCRSEATAVALSADLRQHLYVELRAAPALNVPPRRLAVNLHARVGRSPALVDAIVSAESWQPYGRAVLARFPDMLRTLAAHSRTGEDDKLAVVNCYLPPVAAHNLLMGTELLLTQTRPGVVPADGQAARQTPIDQRLAKTTSLSFAKETLQRAVELLADDLGAEIWIDGRELQAEGITRNQSFGIDLRERPGREILVEILRRANPDKSAAGPADPRQRLVFVVDEPPVGPGRIIVTTRAAAEKRAWPLPAEFLGTGR